jgi:hypothetical protein
VDRPLDPGDADQIESERAVQVSVRPGGHQEPGCAQVCRKGQPRSGLPNRAASRYEEGHAAAEAQRLQGGWQGKIWDEVGRDDDGIGVVGPDDSAQCEREETHHQGDERDAPPFHGYTLLALLTALQIQ